MKKHLLTASCTGFSLMSAANNIQVSNVLLAAQDATANTRQISFTVGWEHSWRTSVNESNYDGAWIFAKFRKVNTSLWRHATLRYAVGAAAAAGHVQPPGAIIAPMPDGKGAAMYRSTAGTGAVTFSGAELRRDYGADSLGDNDSVEMRLFPLEMVYCTPGGFYLGTDSTETGHFHTGGTGSNAPYFVGSESAIAIYSSAGNLTYTTATNVGDGLCPVPSAFPKGTAGFWIMKYESSQQQYAHFLNTLDAASATLRNNGLPGTTYAFTPAVPSRAYGAGGGADLLAYLD